MLAWNQAGILLFGKEIQWKRKSVWFLFDNGNLEPRFIPRRHVVTQKHMPSSLEASSMVLFSIAIRFRSSKSSSPSTEVQYISQFTSHSDIPGDVSIMVTAANKRFLSFVWFLRVLRITNFKVLISQPCRFSLSASRSAFAQAIRKVSWTASSARQWSRRRSERIRTACDTSQSTIVLLICCFQCPCSYSCAQKNQHAEPQGSAVRQPAPARMLPSHFQKRQNDYNASFTGMQDQAVHARSFIQKRGQSGYKIVY